MKSYLANKQCVVRRVILVSLVDQNDLGSMEELCALDATSMLEFSRTDEELFF